MAAPAKKDNKPAAGGKPSGKQVLGLIKLQIPAGKANPSPPVGPALGQKGLNIMDFCKQFNDATKTLEAGMPVPVVITAYADRTFSFITRLAPNTYWIKKELKLGKGSTAPGKTSVGKITREQIAKVAAQKITDMNCESKESAYQIIRGSAISMGLEIVE